MIIVRREFQNEHGNKISIAVAQRAAGDLLVEIAGPTSLSSDRITMREGAELCAALGDLLAQLGHRPPDDWEPASVNMTDYWAAVVGDSYTPVKHGKHASAHPTTVKAVLDQVRGTEVADVIVGLLFWNAVGADRERMAWARVRELEIEAAKAAETIA